MHDAGGIAAVVPMATMGLLTSVVAPALVLLGRHGAGPPTEGHGSARAAAAVLVGFCLLHATVVLVTAAPTVAMSVHVALHAVLLAGAVVFWLPVLDRGRWRLPETGRCVYLFLACPTLDLAALALIVRGDEPAGVAMIVSMLPIAAAAVALTWRWVVHEEHAVRAAEGVRR